MKDCFGKIKDSLQMTMYICAITGTTLFGFFKACVGEEQKKGDELVGKEQPDADVEAKLLPALKPGEGMKGSESSKKVVVNPAPTETKPGVEKPAPEPEKPAVKPKTEPKKPVKPAPKAPDETGKSSQNSEPEVESEPKVEPDKEHDDKPMTEDEPKQIDNKKQGMKKEGEKLHQELKGRKDEGSSQQSPVLTDEERAGINKAEEEHRKKMEKYLQNQEKGTPAPTENKEDKKTE